MIKRIYISLFVCLLSISASAQLFNVRKAISFLQKTQYDSAKVYINKATENEKTKRAASTWYYKGFIYKDSYTKTPEVKNPKAVDRDIAVKSLIRFLELDTVGKLTKSAKKIIVYLASTYYNDAATSLNSDDYSRSLVNYSKYKKATLKVNPENSFDDIDKQYYGVLANVYGTIFDADREKNKAFFNKCINAYLFVLDIDSNDINANYNLAIFYYNEAVEIIKGLDFIVDLSTVDLIQDETVDMFRKSLPYMKKAYKMNPNRKETLIGLVGIYYSLNELEKRNEIQQQLDLLEGK